MREESGMGAVLVCKEKCTIRYTLTYYGIKGVFPPDRMMHRFDLAVASSPPVRFCRWSRERGFKDKSELDYFLVCVVEEFVMVAVCVIYIYPHIHSCWVFSSS